MKTFSLALLLVASAALSGCGSIGDLGLGDLHIGGATPAKPAQTDGLAPQTEDALYLGAVEGLEKQGRFGAALAFLDQYATTEKQPSSRYWLLRGNALLGSSRTGEAADAFNNLDATPLAAQGWNGKGRAAAADKQWQIATDSFQKAVLGDPSNADFLNNLAFAQLHLGRVGEAEGNLRQARELAPGSDLIRNNLAIALTMQGDSAGADDVLKSIASAPERERVAEFARKLAQTKMLDMERKS